MRVSVVIPTLNEEAYVAQAIHSVRIQSPHEIIVVDGGSTDCTRQMARDADLFLQASRGRASQMNFAAGQATGDILLFLHADCMLEEGALAEAGRLLRQPGVAAGCFCQQVVSDGFLYRSIDFCASIRVRLTGIAYGDQGIFLKRDRFERVRGFPEVPLMEDLFLSRKLRRLGKIVVAPKRVFVSARRWRKNGLVQQTMRNWAITAMTAAGVKLERLGRFYAAVR